MTSYANDIIHIGNPYKCRVLGRGSLVHSWHLVREVRIFCRMTPQVEENSLLKGSKGVTRRILLLLLKRENYNINTLF